MEISRRKIFLIAKREFNLAVRKKTFFWTTVLGPILFSALMIFPVWLELDSAPKKNQLIVSSNQEELFTENQISIDNWEITFIKSDSILAKTTFLNSQASALATVDLNQSYENQVNLFYNLPISEPVKSSLLLQINLIRKQYLISKLNINSSASENLSKNIKFKEHFLHTHKADNSKTELQSVIGISLSVLVYFFIMLYGMQVMSGVREEKSNRIIEVIVTSVKPFELMAGKIIGIASVSFAQFFIWITLTTSISAFISSRYELDRFSSNNIGSTISKIKPNDVTQALEIHKIVSSSENIAFSKTICVFCIYFIFGYLLYASLFAAVAAAVDSDADTQQFLFLFTSPLLFSFLFAQSIIINPNDSFAIFLSIFPLTSPISMLVRLPFGVSSFELFVSIFILLLSVIFVVCVSSKIYRTGILMYGKKITLVEFLKWAWK